MSNLLIVSNRLPVTVKAESGDVRLVRSVGGLATGLRGLHERADSLWLGWPGDVSHLDGAQLAELEVQLAQHRTVPLHLDSEQVSSYYDGFSNSVIWPLFHYLTDRIRLDASRDWQAYRDVNEQFAELVASCLEPGGTVWVQDYQLMLVPELVRQRVPDARIGFFLHIPFPSYEVFRLLPRRDEILQGLLGADLIGFHTHSYLRNFSTSLRYILGLGVEFDRVRLADREVRLGAFPMGIAAAAFSSIAQSPDVAAEVAALRQSVPDAKLLLAVDRLDYTKGIPRRLLAIERLLETHPSLRGAIRFVQVAVPSRTKVESYREARRDIEEMVGRINGAHSSAASVPIHYLYRSVSRQQLVTLYRAADVMLVTPVRDGMNLVAKEFVASRTDGDGVLVLSELAGAAAELGEALQVNPYDIDGTASAIHAALTMPEKERRVRMQGLRRRVEASDVHKWGETFLRCLEEETSTRDSRSAVSRVEAIDGLMHGIRKAPRLALLLDYDGTLVPFAATPDLAAPDRELIELLRRLAARPHTAIHIISGRSRESLEHWLGHLDVGLHAEHGFWARLTPDSPWLAAGDTAPGWKQKILPLLESFAARTPGALIEEKTASIAWHWRLADPEFGAMQALELRRVLDELLASGPAEVLLSEKAVEVRLRGIHKGSVLARILDPASDPPTVVALGDDRTDEQLFAALPEGGIAVHVGPKPTQAPWRLADCVAARRFLGGLLQRPAPEIELPPVEVRAAVASLFRKRAAIRM